MRSFAVPRRRRRRHCSALDLWCCFVFFEHRDGVPPDGEQASFLHRPSQSVHPCESLFLSPPHVILSDAVFSQHVGVKNLLPPRT